MFLRSTLKIVLWLPHTHAHTCTYVYVHDTHATNTRTQTLTYITKQKKINIDRAKQNKSGNERLNTARKPSIFIDFQKF